MDISASSVWNATKVVHLHPRQLCFTARFYDTHHEARLCFVNWYLYEVHHRDSTIIQFSEEVCFISVAVRTPRVTGGKSHVNHKSTIIWCYCWYVEWKVYKIGTVSRTVMSILNSKNVCCHSVQNILSSNVLQKAWSLKCIVLIALFYGCETWCVTIRKKHRLRALRRIFWGEYLDLRSRT
jgi:hypothetical protein